MSGNSFHPTAHDVAELFWRKKAKASKNAAEKEHAERMADSCAEMHEATEAARAEQEQDSARRDRLLAAAAREPEVNECYCGKTFTMKAHLAKHKKACELAKVAEAEDEDEIDGEKKGDANAN